MTKPKINSRIFWGKETPNLPTLDLTAVQRDSYKWFLEEGIAEALNEISPLEDFTGKNWVLEFGAHAFGKPKYTPNQALEKGVTFDFPLKVEATLTNKQTGETVRQEVFLGDIPAMTDQGTFIINGIERCIVNQLVRSPGVFFTGEQDPVTGRMLYMAELRPMHGSWLEFNVSRNDTLTVRIDRRRKFPATTFLRATSIPSDEGLLDTFAQVDKNPNRKFIETTIEHDQTKGQEEAILEIYRKMRPGEPVVLDNAKSFLDNMFFNSRRYSLGKVGRYKLNRKLGLTLPNVPENYILTKEDIIGAIAFLIKLQNGDEEAQVDDIDHLSNRRVRCAGELVATNAFRIGLLRLERTIREKMSLAQVSLPLSPSAVVNARPVIAAINDFFRTSQLSTILDQTNPLAELDNLRRLTVMGTGGISRERASFSIRDINSSQYGRIDPVRSPEGPNIGLVTYMALYARVNEYGFLEAPFRRVVKKNGKMKVTAELTYLAADDEQKFYVTHAGINISADGTILEKRVPARFRGEFLEVPVEQIQFIDLTPREVVGASASLIPFISHDEANRALMGTHMQCQAVPLIKPAAPLVGTGMEGAVAQALGRVVRARHAGKVIYTDAAKVVVRLDKKVKEPSNNENIRIEGNEEIYFVEKFKRSAQSTCYSQKPLVDVGQRVEVGQMVIDGPANDDGELALGQNLVIAYMSYEGLGFEDAIVISDRLVREDILTSINIEEYEASVVETKLGAEETTRDIPNVGEEALLNLDEEGIVVIGAEVGPNDILVGKIAPKGETELTAEERLLRAIFGEKAREVRDTSLRMPHGERGMVVDIKILDKEKGDELEPGTNRKIIVKVAQIRKVVVGDKLAGRHGNKGVISKIVPKADMPYLPDGTAVDIIISPLSVLSRMNLGQLLEAHLGWAAKKLDQKIAVPVFEKIAEEKIIEELRKAGLPVSGKTVLFDGRTGEPFAREIVVGVEYIMKLIHMVEDKTHARSTGPYSLVTQQPLGGKAQMGGQRLGEMEVWALESHRAAHTLQEMLTIKSDDVVGRARAFEAIVKGVDIPTPTVPESFKVLIKELQALALDVTPLGVVTAPQILPGEEGKEKAQAQELAVAAGEKLVADQGSQPEEPVKEEA